MRRLGLVLAALGLSACSVASTPTAPSHADDPGDPGTPCAVTYTLAHGILQLKINTQRGGELLSEPFVNGTGDHGHYLRRDIPHVAPGALAVDFKAVHSVDEIATVLYTTDRIPHICSVVRQGDPVPQQP